VGSFGQPRRHGAENHLHDTVGVLENVVVPEANDSPAGSLKSGCPILIITVFIMLSAIDFDREPCLPAGKIEDCPADDQLSREARAILAKHDPQSLLGVGWRVAK
jgi:hypothetical protein